MPELRRVAVIGADSLLGRELIERIEARRFGWVVESPGEADFVFLAAPGAAVPAGLPGVDCAALPHPVAAALGRLIALAAPAGGLHTAAAIVFDSASRRDMAGIQELERQTTRLLSLQSLPTEVFGGQVAFNLRPAPERARAALAAQLAARLDAARHPRPALQLFQAPLFHGALLSVYLAPCAPRPIAAPGIVPVDSLDAMAVAGQDEVLLAPPRGDGEGVWLFAGLDNLRHTALAALAAAEALLA